MSHKGKNDDQPTKDSLQVDLEHIASDDKHHSGVTHPPTCTVKDAVLDTAAHDAARRDHFRRAGLTAKGGSAKRDKTGAKGAK
jgi:hypothetical protein